MQIVIIPFLPVCQINFCLFFKAGEIHVLEFLKCINLIEEHTKIVMKGRLKLVKILLNDIQ